MDVSKLPYHHPSPWDTEIESTTMPALFGRAVDAHPQRTLIEFLGRKLSYQAMHAEARRFAAGLQERGIGRGDRVGLFLPNVPIYLSAYYGAMMAGATVVNFSPLYSVEELEQQVADSGTRLLVTVEKYPELQSQARFADLMVQLEGTENRIEVARNRYNEAVQEYNTTIRTFPATIAANVIYGSEPMQGFEARAGAENAPDVNFDDLGGASTSAAPANDNTATGADQTGAATGTDN